MPLVEPCCPAQSVCHITVTSDVRANIKYIYSIRRDLRMIGKTAVLRPYGQKIICAVIRPCRWKYTCIREIVVSIAHYAHLLGSC